MAEKRTKADKLQRNVERLDKREEGRPEESEIKDNQSELARTVLDPAALQEKIRLRAYELFEARGRQHGHDLDDWLQAEAEILASKKTVTTTQRKAAAAA